MMRVPSVRVVRFLGVVFLSILAGLSARAAAADEVTLRGPYLCAAAQLHQSKEHVGAIYAFEGPEAVQAALGRAMAEYPDGPLDVDGARKFQAALDREVLYFIEPNDVEKKAHRESEFWCFGAEVVGTVSEHDGRKWVTPTAIKAGVTVQPPKALLRPDRPLVMPKGKPIDLAVTDKLSVRCVPIPAGSFVSGSPFYQWPRCHDEYPHEVVLTRDYYLSETPITQEVFEAVMGKNPTPEGRRGPQDPVENVLWDDILSFCQRLSAKTGRRVRLPTGAEFEYAARVGTSDACFPAKYVGQESDVGNKAAKAAPVKTKKPNAWGCYDMLTFYGWHACSDYDTTNPMEKQVDPTGPPAGGPGIYNKGGHRALGGDQNGVRPNIHYWYFEGPKPEADGHWVGIFRVVVEAEAPPPAGAGAKP
jgi:formylglycine-generating enzyme required for sulfatase activity